MLQDLMQYDYFRYFKELSSVPRGSGHNEKISDFLVAFAKEQGLWYQQDEAYNVIIRKPASEGYEDAPGIILQGHMDMVCEAESGYAHDFTKEGLTLKSDGDFLYAEHTTLGGDDGIALAYGMAILANPSLKHPALELVVTTDEETGMYGAKALDASILQGKYMINLDTEEEGSLLAGCAGGLRADITLSMKTKKVMGIQAELKLGGLQGGHSGCEIDKNRTNATRLLGRVLFALSDSTFYIQHMEGGSKDNAIPREASAILCIPENDFCEFAKRLEKELQAYREELGNFEPDFCWTFEKREAAEYEVVTKESADKVLFLLNTAPDGVQVMSGEINGLVESSLNMGIFSMDLQRMQAFFSIRSSRNGYKEYVGKKLQKLSELLGGTYEEGEAYPAWVYKKDSPLREKMVEIYRKKYGKEPVVEVIHAGLECGIISQKRPDIDIVAIGPDILDIHTPKERLSISSTIRVYEYLVSCIECVSDMLQ